MTRLKYRDDGMSGVISNDLAKAKTYLENAMYYSNFNIPSDFKYRDSLSNTKYTINNQKRILEKAANQIYKTDDDLLKIFKRIDKLVVMDTLDKIPNKERLIK